MQTSSSSKASADNPGARVLAGLRPRSAAVLLDCLILLSAACFLLLMFRNYAPVHTAFVAAARERVPVAYPIGAGLVLVTVYSFLFEWILSATPGKLICRLRVRSLGQSRCGFIGALVRAVIRPLDLFCGPLVILMSPGRQRLGDRVAGTTVVILSEPSAIETRHLVFASWEERLKAAIIDVVLLVLATVLYLYALGLVVSVWPIGIRADPLKLIFLALLLVWYFVITEGFWRGTVGKLVCGLNVVSLDRGTSPFAAAVLRASCYLLNFASLGIVPFLLIRYSRKRQNAADLLAFCAVAHTLKA